MSEPEYIVCWRGDSWREVPQPVMAATTTTQKAKRPTQAGQVQARYTARELVYACVDSCFASVNAVKARTGLSDRTVRRLLMEGAEMGTLERIEQGRVGYKGGYPTFLYRRVRRDQVAA